MSRKRKAKKQKTQAVPEEILAEGSGPHADAAEVDADAQSLADAAAVALAGAESADHSEAAIDDVAVTPEEHPAEAEASVEAAAEASSEAASEPAIDAASGDAEHGAIDAAEGMQAAGIGEPEPGVQDLEAAAGDDAGEDADADVAVALPNAAAAMDAAGLKNLVEALVFAADKPVTIQRLRQLTRVSDIRRLEQALAALAEDYRDRGMALQTVSGGYQFRTNTRYSAWVQQLIAGRPVRLSRAQLETLSIIAYRQPITRPEIDEIRGVDSSGTLRVLIERSLIRILGKREEVGRPMLYGTTKEFLDFFSLGDLRELPTLREYSELTAESRRVMSDRLGIEPDENVIDHDPADSPVAEAAPESSVDGEVIEAHADGDAIEAHAEEAHDEDDGIEAHPDAEAVEAHADGEAIEAHAEGDALEAHAEDDAIAAHPDDEAVEAASLEAGSEGEVLATDVDAIEARGDVAAADDLHADGEAVAARDEIDSELSEAQAQVDHDAIEAQAHAAGEGESFPRGALESDLRDEDDAAMASADEVAMAVEAKAELAEELIAEQAASTSAFTEDGGERADDSAGDPPSE